MEVVRIIGPWVHQSSHHTNLLPSVIARRPIPSPDSRRLLNQLADYTERAAKILGFTYLAAIDILTALSSGMANQQLANDPGGDRWVRLVDDVVDNSWPSPSAEAIDHLQIRCLLLVLWRPLAIFRHSCRGSCQRIRTRFRV
jgi:hypothetical protein